ncbi:MAG: ComEC/Rec2 family competence protein [Eubacterium sp.]
MKNLKKYLSVFAVLAVITGVVISAFNGFPENDDETVSVKNTGVTVHFLDVGQGDSEFVELPEGKCMLIDASTAEYGDDIVSTVQGLGYDKIDYLVATHPHADHIGGMAQVIESLDIGEIYMPKAVSTTKTFENLLETISHKNLQITTATAGKEICTYSDVTAKFLAPVSDSYDETNDYSAVVKITYGDNSFLFMGDAEKLSEDEMLANDIYSLNADVLKVGHHGSSSSTGTAFLQAVNPKYAVISCGEGNSYGHPHKETVDLLNSFEVAIFRTDKDGTVTVRCDSKGNYDVTTGG